MSIPKNVFNVIFGICAQRAIKTVLTKGCIALLRFLHCLLSILLLKKVL